MTFDDVPLLAWMTIDDLPLLVAAAVLAGMILARFPAGRSASRRFYGRHARVGRVQ